MHYTDMQENKEGNWEINTKEEFFGMRVCMKCCQCMLYEQARDCCMLA